MADKARNDATATAEARQRSNANLRPFKKGQSGNPKGSAVGTRRKLDEVFLKALYDDFKTGGVAAIHACRTEKPDVYLNVIAKVLPKQVEFDATDAAADLAQGLHAVADFLAGFAADESGADHEGSMPDRPVLSAGVRAQTH